MTANRDADRIVRAWLDLMPNEAPDRTIAAVIEAVDETPQVRRRLDRRWRFASMPRLGLIAGAAVVVALATFLLLPRAPSAVGPPGATASPAIASVVPSDAALAPAPDRLVHRWLGAPRSIPDLGSSEHTMWEITATGASLSGSTWGTDAMTATLGVAGTEIRLSATPKFCDGSQIGHYTWAVSAGGSQLHVAGSDDPCAARRAAFEGNWYRIGCKAENICFGDVDAGTYPTVNWGPKLDPDLAPASIFAAATYTLPAGWAVAGDHTTDLRFVRSDAYARETADGPADGKMNGIEAWIHPAAAKQPDSCDGGGPSPSIAETPTGLTGWLASLPSLHTSTPTSVTIDGHPGRSIDIQISPSWTKAGCGSSDPGVTLFVEGVGAAGPVGGDPWGVGISGKSRLRVTALDLGGGRTVLLIIRADDPTAFDATVQAATPIVQSFRFH